MNTLFGVLLFVFGGLAGATFTLPFRKIKGIAYESYWLVYSLFALIVFPLAFAFATVPDIFGIIGKTPVSTLALCAGSGALWGMGGLSWGLMIRYLGVGLGLAIGFGLCSATGTLIPPIVKGQAASLVADTSAVVTLAGVMISLLGIVFVLRKAMGLAVPEGQKFYNTHQFNGYVMM